MYTLCTPGVCIYQPIHTRSGQNRPDNTDNIFRTRAFFGKYLKEKSLPEAKQQLPFKYIVTFCFIPKLFSKVLE